MSDNPDPRSVPADQRSTGPNETMIISSDEISARTAPGAASAGEAKVIQGTPTLVGRSPLVEGFRLDLTNPKTSVGRAPNNDVVIDDGTVSARHAQIVNEKGTWRVVNLISTNGTAVNGRTNIVSYLAPGDVISFGRVEMVFEAPAQGGARAVRTDGPARRKQGGVHPAVWVGIGAGLLFVVAAVGYLLTR